MTSAPLLLRPRPHHPVLRRSTSALQFGVGPGGAVEVSGIDPTLRRLLLDWHGAQPRDELVRRGVEMGLDAQVVRTVLAELHEAGAVVDAAVNDRVLATRADATVLVSGAGPLVASVAAMVAAAGVGHLAVSASGTVLAEDVGAFTAANRGQPRRTAAVDAVHRVAPGVRCEQRVPRGRVDLVVLTDHLDADAGQRPSAVRAAPHLLVRLVDGLGLVGPLVLPGRSACLRCVALHHAARDPCWPVVAADLAGRVGSAGAATVAATAAIAAEQALAALDELVGDGAAPPTLDGVLELDARSGTLRRQHWPPHPRCGCGAAHIPDRGPPIAQSPADASVKPGR